MRLKRLNAARSVADRLFAAELALDLAVTKIAELNAALPQARIDANISALVGQNALESSAAAMLLVARTREQIVMTHSRLKLASADMGLGEVSFGDALKAPSARADIAPRPRLRVA